MDKFNKVFQKSTQNTTCQLYTEMNNRLVRLYASNILKPEVILAASANLGLLGLDSAGQLSDENLGIGDSTWTYISALEEERDIKPIFSATRSFYMATLQNMLKKFPFGDTILKDLGIINPLQVSSYSFNTIACLAKRFKQLCLADSSSIDRLRDDSMDFTLSPADLPDLSLDSFYYKSVTGDKNP